MNIKKISKNNMAARVAASAESAPSIEDRLNHAKEVVNLHPTASRASVKTPELAPARIEAPSANGGVFVEVDINQIDENPFNARKIYRPERVKELADSIGAIGQDVPGIATIRNGRYILAAGHYRRKAIKLLELPTMSLMVHEGLSDKELFEFSYRENAEREGQSALDNALAWADLLSQGLFESETEIAEVTGFSLANVNKTLRILKISAQILEIVKEDPSLFPMSNLYELSLYEEAAGNSERTLEIAKLMKEGEISRKGIQEARAKLEKPKGEKQQRKTSRAYKINKEGENIGSIKEWDTGRVLLDVVLSDSTEREAIMLELKTRFGIQGAE